MPNRRQRPCAPLALLSVSALGLAVCLAFPATAVSLPALGAMEGITEVLTAPPPSIAPPSPLELRDRPGDDGTGLLLTFGGLSGDVKVLPEIQVGADWLPTESVPLGLDLVQHKADLPQYFGNFPQDPDVFVMPITAYLTPPAEEGGESQATDLEKGTAYTARLAVYDAAGQRLGDFPAGSASPTEQWFNAAKANNLILCILLSVIILAAIAAARKNPNLFIRRINGLEAVDEAVGRATEMGKPVFHINGLDGLTVLSTLAGVNILGRIARITANYETQLVVPAFDPVVLNVSQEVVRQAYLEAGRPDAYRADDIFFVTDQQFSYVATVCGMMLRDRPAAIFLLGSFYAESLMLAETGASTGAIQIAGTDQQAQLPFFITTCDYTLIGEELFAASAYLSREPLLLGSLKGQDVGKALITLLIIIGVVAATAFKSDLLVKVFTAL
jgi:hypothetical protein